MIKQTLFAIGAIVMILNIPSTVYAEEFIEQPNNLLISEVQVNGPGSGTTTQEYIELYNNTDEPVIVAGWSIIYKNSSAKETVLYSFLDDFSIAPRSFFVGKNSLTSSTYLPEVAADFVYTLPTSGLAASGGGILIKDANQAIIDEASWSNEPAYINDNTISGLSNGFSIQRKCTDDITLQTEGSVTNTFYVDMPSPVSLHCVVTPKNEDNSDDLGNEQQTGSDTDQSSNTQNSPPSPERLRLPIYINELFIDPVTPLTDANDEYVEIFNPNPTALDLSGYTLIAGTTTKYRYTFPAGSIIAAESFVTISSVNTSISLSNSGSTVELLDDRALVVARISYGKAIPGEAWARTSNDDWVWTSSPTLAATNIITSKPISVATKKTTKKATTKKSSKSVSRKKTNFSVALPIQINEVFPDPKTPQTDAKDEFIELYNPHPMAINITDYTLKMGATRQYSYTFPEGSVIAPFGYVVIDSANTNISLTNDGGTVTLINNFDKEIDSVTYTKAPSGQSYARNDIGTWQWTSTVTRSSQNSIVITSANNTKTTVAGASNSSGSARLQAAPQPLPTWVLALLGVSAVCYAAYEYRFEARNYIHKLRTNRTTG